MGLMTGEVLGMTTCVPNVAGEAWRSRWRMGWRQHVRVVHLHGRHLTAPIMQHVGLRGKRCPGALSWSLLAFDKGMPMGGCTRNYADACGLMKSGHRHAAACRAIDVCMPVVGVALLRLVQVCDGCML